MLKCRKDYELWAKETLITLCSRCWVMYLSQLVTSSKSANISQRVITSCLSHGPLLHSMWSDSWNYAPAQDLFEPPFRVGWRCYL